MAVPDGSAVAAVVPRPRRDADGRTLDPRFAPVELLDINRPTMAVTWFVAFTDRTLHRWPAQPARLRAAGPTCTE